MKRYICMLVVATFFVGLFAGYALGDERIRIFIDNKELQTDVAPVVQNGRVLVPLRAVAEGLGAEVTWDDTNRTVSICSGKPSSSPAMDTDINGLLNTVGASVPASPPSIDPLMMKSDGTTPGWTTAFKAECGAWNAVTHLFVGVNANPIPRGTALRITTTGLSRDLAATTLKDTNGFYPQGEGPDSLYVALIPPALGAPVSQLIKPEEMNRSGIQTLQMKVPADFETGTAQLIVVWGWRGQNGYRRFVAVRSLEVVGN